MSAVARPAHAWFACWFWAMLLACGQAGAQSLGMARESAVKAAFLYKFGSFVAWPEGTFRLPGDAFVIGVFGNEAVASELEQITRGRGIDGRRIVIQRVRDADDAAGSHILFAGGPRTARARELLAEVRGAVLTVADGPSDSRPSPVLHFTHEEGRVRFAASLEAASARGLKLSSRLLAVAHYVEGR